MKITREGRPALTSGARIEITEFGVSVDRISRRPALTSGARIEMRFPRLILCSFSSPRSHERGAD